MKKYAVYCTGLQPDMGICQLTSTFECEIGSAVYLVDPLRPSYAHMAFVRVG